MNWSQLLSLYQETLHRNVMPFWLKYGIDREYGGFFNFLTDEGRVVSEEKVLWSQGRGLWTLSALYNHFDRDAKWLEYASQTAQFLLEYGRDDSGLWRFRVARDGRPLEGPQSIYVDAFIIYGLTEYVRATGDQRALEAAIESYRCTSPMLRDHSRLSTRPHPIPSRLQSHGPSMIFALVYHELGLTANDPEILARALELAETVMTQHLKPEHHLLYEFVLPGGRLAPGDAGETFLPGHAIESMWFMERIYSCYSNRERIRQAMDAIRWHLERGWDEEFGGIFLARHAHGGTPCWHSPDSKVWWPATESLYALLRSYEVTGESWCLEWYDKVHDYAFHRYPNHEHGEWFQNLDRQGNRIPAVVAGLEVKDPFHLPRSLIYSIAVLRRLNQTTGTEVLRTSPIEAPK
ncbi:MAG TPA: AGE family epimerase/isomerase [Terriglobales bacterium]|nr:AGE family epimerase/isomerase [Terriglobales bacterium]